MKVLFLFAVCVFGVASAKPNARLDKKELELLEACAEYEKRGAVEGYLKELCDELNNEYESGVTSGYKRGVTSGYKRDVTGGYKRGVTGGYKRGVNGGKKRDLAGDKRSYTVTDFPFYTGATEVPDWFWEWFWQELLGMSGETVDKKTLMEAVKKRMLKK